MSLCAALVKIINDILFGTVSHELNIGSERIATS